MNALRNGRLAADEFAFRYLFPEDVRNERWPIDEVEQRFQFHAPRSTPADGAKGGRDLEPLFRANLCGQTPAGSLRERLLGVLLAVHSPVGITPHSGYGIHASYPSPRAYYPLSFLLADHEAGSIDWVDTEELQLRPAPREALLLNASKVAGSRLSLWVKVEFKVYDPLYNLFRKSLFLLETGHFLGELLALGSACGLVLTPRIDAAGIRVDVSDAALEASPEAGLRHLRFARRRNSGCFAGGLFPANHRFSATERDRLADAIRAAFGEAGELFPITRDFPLSARPCLRAGEGVAPGIFAVESSWLRPVDDADPVDACERHYNYQNFSFSSVPGLVYLGVDPKALSGADHHFFELNVALGYVSQRLIRYLSTTSLIGRPFRSYDQYGMDRLLRHDIEGRTTYYGLLIGRNRCQEPAGVLR